MPDASQDLREYPGLAVGQKFIEGNREFERSWLRSCQERGLWRLWWLIYCCVHGIDSVTGENNANAELKFAGDQDQYAKFRVAIARRYLQQRKQMAQDQRIKFTGVAVNDDVNSLVQVNTATRAMEYMLTEGRLEAEAARALESLCFYGAGGLLLTWNSNAGDMVPAGQEPQLKPDGNPVMMPQLDESGNPIMAPDPETGVPVEQLMPQMQDVQKKSGCPQYRKLYPWQIVLDVYQETDHNRVVVKLPVNKYELAARVPEKASQILGLTIDEEMGDDALFAWGGARAVSSDTVVMRMYFERDNIAVPGGRFAAYVQDVGLWGVDEILPNPLGDKLPVDLMVGPHYHGTAFGFPESSDLLSLQTVMNEALSMCITNMQKRGNPNAYKREDVQIDPLTFSMGGGLIDLPAGAEPPVWDEPPSMDSLSEFVINFISEQARLIAGSNSVVEGNPTANISSGAFAVLLVNVAQRYSSDYQQAHDEVVTQAANNGLKMVKTNAKNGFWAQMAGIADSPYVSIMQTNQLSSLHSVKLVRDSPVLSTFAGRIELFDRLVVLPKRDRADAADMMMTGRMESFAERDQAAKIRVRKENEMILQGIVPQVMLWDDHAVEGPEHRALLDKLRSMDPPADMPQTPPPPVDQRDPAYQMWLSTGGPKFAAWNKAIWAADQHLLMHSNALAAAPPPIAVTAGWAPLQLGDPNADPNAPEQGGGGPPKKQDGQPGPNGGQSVPKPPSSPKSPRAPKGADSGAGSSV